MLFRSSAAGSEDGGVLAKEGGEHLEDAANGRLVVDEEDTFLHDIKSTEKAGALKEM